jgi:quercetin dioxygenase-like cupin family protein
MQCTSITTLIEQHLGKARSAASGRSAQTIHGGRGHTLRQTLVALAAGQRLDEHENPGEATVHVLHGRVRLSAGADSREGRAGDLIVVPDTRHSLEALDDAAILLTVAVAGGRGWSGSDVGDHGDGAGGVA